MSDLTSTPPFETVKPFSNGDLDPVEQLGWVSHLTFDAELRLDGLTWLRVAGPHGIGSADWPRESWVLAVPSLAVGVNRFLPTGYTRALPHEFGPGWGHLGLLTFTEAARVEVEQARKSLGYQFRKNRQQREQLDLAAQELLRRWPDA